MPDFRCHYCHRDFSATDGECPACGHDNSGRALAPGEPHRERGAFDEFSLLCLNVTVLAAFLGIIATFLAAVFTLMKGEIAGALVTFIIGMPVSVGVFTALRIANRLAQGGKV